MADNTLLRRLLTDEEGVEGQAYKDTLGYWTIAIGHRLDIEQSDDELLAMGLTESLDNWKGFNLTDKQIHDLFDIDVQDAIDDLYSRDESLAFTDEELDALGETRRAIILSMVFQLGGTGFRKFKNFIATVKAGDFDGASKNMMNSLAARQTPQRWQRASQAMLDNYFQGYNAPESVSFTQGNVTPVANDISVFSDAELITELHRRLVKGEV